MYNSIIILPRCVESGAAYLSSNIERITEASNGHSLVVYECVLSLVGTNRYSYF